MMRMMLGCVLIPYYCDAALLPLALSRGCLPPRCFTFLVPATSLLRRGGSGMKDIQGQERSRSIDRLSSSPTASPFLHASIRTLRRGGFNQRLSKDGAPSNKSTNRRGGPRTRERKICGVVVEVLAGAFPWGRLLPPSEAGSGAGGRSAFARCTVPSLGPAGGFGRQLPFFGSDRGRVKSRFWVGAVAVGIMVLDRSI